MESNQDREEKMLVCCSLLNFSTAVLLYTVDFANSNIQSHILTDEMRGVRLFLVGFGMTRGWWDRDRKKHNNDIRDVSKKR